MIDHEKVIKGLKCCLFIHRGGLLEESCNQCPYQAEPKATCDCQHLLWDALVLLKEQEPIEPINSYGTFRCGNCRNIVGYNDGHGCGYQNNFCSKCGQAVKW